MTTIDFVARATSASLPPHRLDSLTEREMAYLKAFARRLRRELLEKGTFGNASQCLIALSSRVMDVVA